MPQMQQGGLMKSSDYFEQARMLMPGGVSSPVRAIRPYPFYTKSARGSRITTIDGEDLIDCCMAYGPLILGHAHALAHHEGDASRTTPLFPELLPHRPDVFELVQAFPLHVARRRIDNAQPAESRDGRLAGIPCSFRGLRKSSKSLRSLRARAISPSPTRE